MIMVKHELKQGKWSLIIWTTAIAFLMIVCIFLFPEMKGEMDEASELFSSMGSFTAAFGMDRLNFGTLIGFYGIECGNILGLGGAFFAALTGITMLAKEEKGNTAEFLLSHPVSRRQIVLEKLLAVIIQIILLNGVVLVTAFLSILAVGEEIPVNELLLLHLAYFLVQLELAGICFGISAFIRGGGMGIGLGIAAMMYFLNLIANITDKAEVLKYITPFGYAEGADIITNGSLDEVRVLIGLGLGIVGIAVAFIQYGRKDI